MTQYATTADLALYGLNAVALEAIPSATQTAALLAASSLLDGYFAGQATLPLMVWGTDVTQRTCEVAAFNLLVGRGFNPDSGSDQVVRQRYEDAIRWAEQVSHGTITPQWTDSTPSANPGGGNPPIVVSGTQRGWSRRGTTRGRGGFIGD